MLRGPKAAVRACWVYVALFSTAFVALSYAESFPVFLMLASVLLSGYSAPVWGAAVVAGGFMAKLFPIGVLPALLKCDARWRWRCVALGAFALGVGVLALPFLFARRPWLALSFEVTAKRPPWGTVWALLDERHEFGYVGPGQRDQSPAFFQEEAGFGVAPYAEELLKSAPPEVFGFGPPAARRTHFYHVAGHFATKPRFLDWTPKWRFYWLLYGGVGVVLGIFYLVTLARMPSALPPRRRLYLAAFTMVLLFFYAKGWSPQFVLYLIPLLLIAFPFAEGGLWALVLTVLTFLEMPVWTVFVNPYRELAVTGSLLLHAIVIARTAAFLAIAARLYPRLFSD
jgi:hypothetical protein